MKRTFDIELSIDATYSIEKYTYGSDADGRRGEKRTAIEDIEFNKEIVLKAIEGKIRQELEGEL